MQKRQFGTSYLILVISLLILLLPNSLFGEGKVYSLKIYNEVSRYNYLGISCESFSVCRNASIAALGRSPDSSDVVAFYDDSSTPEHYGISRTFLFFDTSPIPSNVQIKNVILTLSSTTALPLWALGNRTIHVLRSTAILPLGVTDYNEFDYSSGLGGTLSFAPDNNLQSVMLNAPARNWIVKTGMTKLVLIHDNDYRNIIPLALDGLGIWVTEDSEYRPNLTVEYVLTSMTPVVSLLLKKGDGCSDPQTVMWEGREWQRCGDGNDYNLERPRPTARI